MSSVLAGAGFHRKLEALDSNRGKTNPQAGSQPQNDNQRRRERMSMSQPVETVVVAVNAAKEITKHALEWALTNVVQPGDHITLLALWPSSRNGRKLWGLPKFAGDCANGLKKGFSIENLQELEEEINDSCSFVMQQLHKLCDAKKVKVSVKVVKSAVKGAPAMEAQRAGATWVVLDRQLKKEGKSCMEQLDCNLVVVNRHSPKILRLNLRRSPEEERMEISDIQVKGKVLHSASDEGTPSSSPETGTPFTATEPGTTSTSSSEPGLSPPTSSEPQRGYAASQMRVRGDDRSGEAVSVTDTESDSGVVDAVSDTNSDNSGPLCRTASVSPKQKSLSSTGRCGRSFDTLSQPWFEISKLTEEASQRDSFSVEPWKPAGRTRPNSANATPKLNARQGRTSTPASPLTLISKKLAGNGRLSFSMREGGSGRNLGSSTHPVNSPVVSFTDGGGSHRYLPPEFIKSSWQASELSKVGGSKRVLTTKELLEKFSEWDQEAGRGEHTQNRFMQGELERTSSVRKAMSLSRHVPAGPPPLCSICQHKAPVFGKPPRRFTYAELELATGSFSNANFLAEGGFGSVHRGVLPDGQAVAVKQHKLASSQGDIEFCSEVEVLSCAQHRNVVMLIGYCIEEKRRLLVYEFICNGSLDSHLYGRDRSPLEWPARQTIAVGAAKGLRYLHEECRVGCIVHRDMRPNNILLTHDFEPMVGDFGLARWQPDGDLGVQTRVIGTFGYLAPEYAQSGQITEKADVYSFGVVLLELVTGRKAVDINRPKGQQCLTEWARPLLDEHATQDLIDPRLEGRYSDYEVYCMLHGASLCIRRDPHLRPRMSQVLRILEGDIIIDTSGSSTPSYSGKLAYDHAPYGSRSSRISSEYVVNRLGTLSPPLISYSGSLAAEPRVAHSGKLSMCAETLVNYHSSKLSYEALKAAYKDRANSRRLSYEDMMRISEN